MTMRRLLHRGSMLLAVQAFLVPVVHAQQCRSSTATPPNVILLVADDLGWSDLPFFNPPIHWNGTPASTKQYKDVRPDLNRLAARLNAERPGGALDEFQRGPLVPGDPPPSAYTVIPVDATTSDPADHQYSHLPGCGQDVNDCREDVLQGFAGLREISRGVAFSRFYAASAICASTRATIFSGRYPQRTGVNGNGGKLPHDEVTIPELLTQGCPGRACFGWRDTNGKCCLSNPSGACPAADLAPCYRTGLIGKWHLGEEEGKTTPWDQGFTEFVGHPRSCCRGYFSRSPLTCSPGPGGAPLYVGPEIGGTCTNSLTSSRDCCDSDDKYYVPGRGDAGTHQGSFPCNDDVNEAKCSGGVNHDNPCDSDDDCSGGFCWRGDSCLTGDFEGSPCSTDVQCADAACVQSCTTPDCKVGCFYQNKCGCNYGTRAYRDLALNFIRRHCDEPFFLTVTFNATHIGHNAPQRTGNHYRTDGVPSKFKFWGAVEELDAAAGRIIDELRDLGLDDNTLLFFNADQGRPGGNYGDPVLRGGKGGVYDGGIRVGLLGRARTGDLYGLDDLDAHLGSHVDILPTVAEAAGASLARLPTPSVFRTCPDGSRGCPADCPTETCNDHFVDGRSFYGLLSIAASPGATPTPARDLAFATYGQMAVVARRKLVPTPTPGARICGYAAENANHIGIRGGSCVACDQTCPAETRCQILGKVCVSPDGGLCRKPNGYTGTVSPTPCTSDRDCSQVGSTCVHPAPTGGFERCKSGCSQGRACAEIHVDCNNCLDAAWKLRSGDSEGQTLPSSYSVPLQGAETDALYDLSTNPEEQANLDCKEKVPNIWFELKRNLLNWDACSSAASCKSEDCEGWSEKPPCLTQ